MVRSLLAFALGPFSRLKYGIRIERFKEQEKRPYFVLYNHQTPFDQFFVGLSFRGPIYYVATEDIFSKGWISSLIRFLVAPIPFKKSTADVKAILNCKKIISEGGTIAIAPEGNRTYSGRTGYINPSIAPLARKLGVPIVLYRIEGGYGVQPRWSDAVRRGRMKSYVSSVIMPEEYAKLSDAELYARICDGLYVNESRSDGHFRHKRLAEYAERALYVCPFCGISSLESHKDTLECLSCHKKVRFNDDRTLSGVGFELPFRFFGDWYDYQESFVNGMDAETLRELSFSPESVQLLEVIPSKSKRLISKKATLELRAEVLVLSYGTETLTLSFDKISAAAVLGRNKLNIYVGDKLYQVKGSKRFNALKFVNLYYRYKNITQGENKSNVKFLGL